MSPDGNVGRGPKLGDEQIYPGVGATVIGHGDIQCCAGGGWEIQLSDGSEYYIDVDMELEGATVVSIEKGEHFLRFVFDLNGEEIRVGGCRIEDI